MSTTSTTADLSAQAARRSFGECLLELSKARLSALVVLTTGVGFVLGSGVTIDWVAFALTLLGTGISAAGANTLNQCRERERDARMQRTRKRPLPAAEISPATAWTFGLACAITGPIFLALSINLLTAVLGAVTIALYVLVYTPLKVRTPQNTLVGAVVGAIPPLMGWTAATGDFAGPAWTLAAILFCWQMPHFLALAWLYREDYARGGFRMLPVVDPSGSRVGRAAMLYAAPLLIFPIILTWQGSIGWLAAGVAAVLGTWMLVMAILLNRTRGATHARKLFIASVIYLPIILALFVIDRQPWPGPQADATPVVAVVEASGD